MIIQNCITAIQLTNGDSSTVTNTQFINNEYGLHATNAELTVAESNFTNNGAGIHAKESVVSITNSSFTDNMSGLKATDWSNVTGAHLFITLSQESGVVLETFSKLDISDSDFFNNTARVNGGAIDSYSSSIHAYRVTFSFNTAQVGGAVSLDTSVSASFSYCQFVKNGAGDGGGVSAYKTPVAITYSNFSGCTADSYGGQLYLSDGALGTIEGSLFYGGAAQSGAGMAVVNASAVITDTQITDSTKGRAMVIAMSSTVQAIDLFCTYNKGDGAILVSSSSTLHLSSSSLSWNEATEGGGLLIMDYSNATLVNVNLSGNFVPGIGGAIVVKSFSFISMSSCEAVGNAARASGGAVMLSDHATDIFFFLF